MNTKERIEKAVNGFFRDEFRNVNGDEDKPRVNEITNTDDVMAFYDTMNSEENLPFSFDWLGNLIEPSNGGSVVLAWSSSLEMSVMIEGTLEYSFKDESELVKYLHGLVDLSEKIQLLKL